METRLDRLVREIRELQRPYMDGKGVGDVVLVRSRLQQLGKLRSRAKQDTEWPDYRNRLRTD